MYLVTTVSHKPSWDGCTPPDDSDWLSDWLIWVADWPVRFVIMNLDVMRRKYRKVKSPGPPGVEPRTPLAWAASTLPLSYDSRTTTNPHTAQVVLNASVAHLAATQYVLQNFIRGWLENSLPQERTHAECHFLTRNAQSILPHAGNNDVFLFIYFQHEPWCSEHQGLSYLCEICVVSMRECEITHTYFLLLSQYEFEKIVWSPYYTKAKSSFCFTFITTY